MEQHFFIKSEIKLTIGMLVSNQKKYIRQCMESLKQVLTAIPSELVVVDTVGKNSDGSIEIVREYTDKIYPFVWCNDFSKARNEVLAHASGEWFLYLDDDEWLGDATELIDFFKNGECEKFYSASFLMRNYSADDSYTTSTVRRMIRREVTTKFEGRVHEAYERIYGPCKAFSFYANHEGYRFVTVDDIRKKQRRNLPLLKEEIKEKGETPRLLGQLVQELLALSETFEEGRALCIDGANRMIQAGYESDPCVQWMLTKSVRCILEQAEGKTVEIKKEAAQTAIEQAMRVKTGYHLGDTAGMVLAMMLVEAAKWLEDYSLMATEVSEFEEVRQRRLARGETAELELWADFIYFMSEEQSMNMWLAGIAAETELGHPEAAYTYWKKFPWKREGFAGEKYREALLYTLEHLEEKEPIRDFYRYFYKEEYFEGEGQKYLPKTCGYEDVEEQSRRKFR